MIARAKYFTMSDAPPRFSTALFIISVPTVLARTVIAPSNATYYGSDPASTPFTTYYRVLLVVEYITRYMPVAEATIG